MLLSTLPFWQGSRIHPDLEGTCALVREYIVEELEKLGLAPRIKMVGSTRARGLKGEAVSLQNVLARLPGIASSKAILLSAHYDTCEPAPGAADDSAGVAAILETMRALRAGPRLKNGVIVLITDGEEQGMLGAEGFVSEDESVRDVGHRAELRCPWEQRAVNHVRNQRRHGVVDPRIRPCGPASGR